MNNIQIFKYENNDVRTVEMNGEPWFVLKDVCAVLGMDTSQLKKVADRLEDDEKGRTQITTPGGMQESWVISESGLYNVILRSDKPEAKPFRKWVTSEVLPSIRKTGSYTVPKLSKEMQALFLLDQRTVQQEQRITALENNMVVDYGQQHALRKAVSRAVITALGGKDAPAYINPHSRGRMYSECNNDVQGWFRVNSVCNIPRKRYDEAMDYIQRWKPSTNSVMEVQNINAQTTLFDKG